MATLKKLFPLSFSMIKDVANLVICILIYIVVGVIAPAILGIFNFIPLVSWILGIVSTLLGIYCIAGIVIALLAYFKVLKD